MEQTEDSKSKTKKLLAQIFKFALVGGTSFVIDFVITIIVSALFRNIGFETETAALIGSIFGFCISLIYNYILSMKFVFDRKDDMNRAVEFLIFTALSAIGLGINSAIMYYGVVACKSLMPELVANNPNLITSGVKIVATGVVMVYNFVSRKLILEKKN